MAMATRGLVLPAPAPARPASEVAPSRFTSTADALSPASLPPCCSGRQLQQWRSSTKMTGKLCNISVGRQTHHGGLFLASCKGWQPEMENFEGKRRTKQLSEVLTRALPTEVSAAATALAVGGALFALTKLNKDTETVRPAKTECEACGGSGVCPTCGGEGFVNKNLSTEAAAKARATAKDAATRYTAGLAKKWNYCTTCGGGRGCQSCEGRGWTA